MIEKMKKLFNAKSNLEQKQKKLEKRKNYLEKEIEDKKKKHNSKKEKIKTITAIVNIILGIIFTIGIVSTFNIIMVNAYAYLNILTKILFKTLVLITSSITSWSLVKYTCFDVEKYIMEKECKRDLASINISEKELKKTKEELNKVKDKLISLNEFIDMNEKELVELQRNISCVDKAINEINSHNVDTNEPKQNKRKNLTL